jgi:microcystin-dependent protein
MSFYNVERNPLIRSKIMDMTGRADIFTSVGNIAQVMSELGLLPPVGNVSPFAGTEAPVGYLLCDGSAVSRAEYNALFEIIGESYGAGDSETTFNVPDLKGKVVVCRNGSDSDFNSLGETGGSKTHTLTIAQMPSHNHTGATGNAGSHNHTVANTVQKSGNNTITSLDSSPNEIDNVNTATTTSSTVGDHNHTISAQGGGEAHNNLQPYMVLNYLIKY